MKTYHRIAAFAPFFFFLLVPALCWSQTAGELESLLETEQVRYEQAARFVLEAAEKASLGEAEAFGFARERRWLPKDAEPGSPARLGDISLLIAGSFEIPGGIFYRIFKNSHYAYRELVSRDIIQGRADPAAAVRGEELVFLLGRVLAVREAESGAEKAREAERAAREAERAARQAEREALAAEINARLASQTIKDTSAKATGEGIMISLSNVRFLADSAELSEEEKIKLREISGILRDHPGKIVISGHTALAGEEGGRQRISRERAQAVASYLTSMGVRKAGEITVHGYGASRPVADNATAEGMALNRRVEITLEDK